MALFWNDVALEANRQSHSNGKNEQTGPPLSARALAIVHLAMYDAYAGTPSAGAPLPPYLPGLGTAAAGASVDAAMASAAHATLSALFPSQKSFFDARLAADGATGSRADLQAGVAFGRKVAAAILANRAGDASVDGAGYEPSLDYGAHRVDPDNPGQPYHAPFFGAATRCFASTVRFGLSAPPRPDDPNGVAYKAALREVRGKGIAANLMGTVPSGMAKRTPAETVIGLWWGYDGTNLLGTPPRLYNQIVRKVAEACGNTLSQNIDLLTRVNVAMADAGILAWEQKYLHGLWRPVVGIREHDRSMGPKGTPQMTFSENCDPEWLPLGAPATNAPRTATGDAKNFTPPFPAYPSEHATFGAAAFEVTRQFYGVTAPGPDHLCDGLSFVSDELNEVNADNHGTVRANHVRRFPDGLWGMILENSLSRVFLGVHWRFDGFALESNGTVKPGIGGVSLGLDIARDLTANGLHPATV